MAYTSHARLSVDEARAVALKLLGKKLAAYGFKDVQVSEEADFDGAEVIRMTAEVTEEVPVRELIGVTTDIMNALSRQSDDRFVYLSTQRPGEADVEEAEE